MSRKAICVAALTALCLTGLAACGSDTDDSAAPKKKGASQVAVTLVSGSDGDVCKLDTDTAAAGPVTFTVTNESAAGLTEVELMDGQKILGEKENLAPGLPGASFTLTLGGGDYEIYCPGASAERVPFEVTGEAAAEPTGDAAELLASGSEDYTAYVRTQIDAMVVGVQDLKKAVDTGDVTAAQKAYADARPFYEKIESDVEGFVMDGFEPTDNKGNLDYLIDMRASNLDEAVGWSGFHAVERDLFQAKKITDQTKTYAADLVTNVTKLAEVGKTLEFKPEDLANGAAALLEEVQSGKITGEEEAYSHIDLVDFANNVEGAQQAYAALRPGLEKIDAELVKTIDGRFAAVTDDLEGYKDPEALGGYRPYTAELKASDGKKLSATVQSLQDVLGRLAEKAATA